MKNFRLVNTEGLTGLFHKGRLIPFAKIDDTLAEQLIGKTHVLERVPEIAGTGEALALSPLTSPEVSEAEDGAAASRAKRAGSK